MTLALHSLTPEARPITYSRLIFFSKKNLIVPLPYHSPLVHRDESIDRQDLACKNSPELIDIMSGDCRPMKALLEVAKLQETATGGRTTRVSGTVYAKGIVIAPHVFLKRPQRAKAVHRDGADALDLGPLFA